LCLRDSLVQLRDSFVKLRDSFIKLHNRPMKFICSLTGWVMSEGTFVH
jgi:hypothetical protein